MLLEVSTLYSIKQQNIPFIVITSGSSGKDVIPLCKKYSFIKEVIIFCMNYEYNKHYLNEYPGYVNKVLTSISSIYDYIKSFGADKYKEGIKKFRFSLDDIKMDKQMPQCPVITSFEYDNCYFLVHKAYSHFFGDINNKSENPKFNQSCLNKIKECLFKIDTDNNDKSNLLSKFKELVSINDNNTFTEKAIKEYTGEGGFCYLFNRVMRYFEPGLIDFAYYMGPFLYGLNKYVKENPEVAMNKDMLLIRNIDISNIDFYLYKINKGHIICFPSSTSTSYEEINFQKTGTAAKYNSKKNNTPNGKLLKVKMLIRYKYNKGNISPGIILEKNGKSLSKYSCEKEVLLFPFTFFRINNINENNKTIEMEIINRSSYIEYTLKNNVANRTLFSNLD